MAFDWSMMDNVELFKTKTIDMSNPTKLAKELNGMKVYTEQAIYDGLQDSRIALDKKLAEFMKMYQLDEFIPTIKDRSLGYFFEIEVTHEQAPFVEYGTGIIGEYHPHAEAQKVGWKYDVNKHEFKGWYYFDKTNGITWTAGQWSKPFFYRFTTWIQTSGIITRKINQRLRKLK